MKKRLLIALVVVLALAATASVVWANGALVSYWPFEGTANDVVNGNHGTIHGGPGFVGGKFGQALDFDGVDDYVDCGNDASLKPSDPFTVAAWVKYATFFADTAGHAIVSHGYYYADNGFMLYQSTGDPHNRVRYFVVTDSGRHLGQSPTLLETNTWYHLALVYDGFNLTLYIDGAYDSSAPATGAISWIAATPNFYIGSTYWATGAKFKGLIDEVGFRNRALSAEEIAALSVGIGSLEWLPPIILPDWTLNENATLPIKFKLYDPVGDLICTGLAPTLQVNGQTVDLRFDSTECHYIANFRPTQSDGHTATVLLDGVELGSHDFLAVEAGKANGRGHGTN